MASSHLRLAWVLVVVAYFVAAEEHAGEPEIDLDALYLDRAVTTQVARRLRRLRRLRPIGE